MGVNGVLPRILPASKKIDLAHNSRKRKRPLRIAVDVSGWIAKACHGHGSMLLDDRHLTNFGRANMLQNGNNNERTLQLEFVTQCAMFVLNQVLNLRDSCNARVLAVIDGLSPPIKARVCKERRERREAAARASLTEQDTDKRIKAASRAGAGRSELHNAVIAELLKALRDHCVPVLVAPYEADGQLAYLSKRGYADLIVTNDSDLLCYGANSILYKMEGTSGFLLQRHDLGATVAPLCLMDFSDAMLATMFVAAGCDYCQSLKGIGIVKARNVVKHAFHECQPKNGLDPPLAIVFRELYKNSQEQMTPEDKQEYESNFLRALITYRHSIVYNPSREICVTMGNPPEGADKELTSYPPYASLCRTNMEWTGTVCRPLRARLIAEGWIHPKTLKVYENSLIPTNVQLLLEKDEEEHNNETCPIPTFAATPGSNEHAAQKDQASKRAGVESKEHDTKDMQQLEMVESETSNSTASKASQQQPHSDVVEQDSAPSFNEIASSEGHEKRTSHDNAAKTNDKKQIATSGREVLNEDAALENDVAPQKENIDPTSTSQQEDSREDDRERHFVAGDDADIEILGVEDYSQGLVRQVPALGDNQNLARTGCEMEVTDVLSIDHHDEDRIETQLGPEQMGSVGCTQGTISSGVSSNSKLSSQQSSNPSDLSVRSPNLLQSSQSQ